MPKRRQETMCAARRSRTLLKQSSLDKIILVSGDGVLVPVTQHCSSRIGEDRTDYPGSKSVAHMEREVRDLGRPLCLLGGIAARVGNANDKKALPTGFKRGCRSSNGRAGQVPCIQQGAPEPCRRGRRDNVARKGNMAC